MQEITDFLLSKAWEYQAEENRKREIRKEEKTYLPLEVPSWIRTPEPTSAPHPGAGTFLKKNQ